MYVWMYVYVGKCMYAHTCVVKFDTLCSCSETMVTAECLLKMSWCGALSALSKIRPMDSVSTATQPT